MEYKDNHVDGQLLIPYGLKLFKAMAQGDANVQQLMQEALAKL